MSGSRQVRIEILGSAKGAQAAFQALDGAADKTQGVLGRVTGGLGKFGSAIGSAAKLAGGFVIAKAIYDAPGALLGMAQAAADDAASLGRLQQAVENSGSSWGDYSGKVNDAITQGQNLAFSDDDTRNALTLLTQETGNAGDALTRLHSAQDLARGANIDLGTASKLLGKITDDNVGVLKRYGITIDKNSTAQDLLNKVDARFGGQAAKFATSDAGKVARLKDQWGELQEAIGYKVLPILSALTTLMLGRVLPMLTVMIDVVGRKATAAWASLSGLLRGPTLQAWHLISAAVDTARKHFDLIRRVIGDLLTVASGPFGNAIRGMIRGFGRDGLSGILPGALDGLRKFRDALLDLGSLALQALGSVDWVGLGKTILSGIGGALGSLASLATGVDWGKVASDIIDGVVAGFDTVTDFGTRWGSWAVTQFTNVDWSTTASTVGQKILDAIVAVTGLTWDAATWLGTTIASVDWTGLATTIGQKVIDGIVALTGLAWDAATFLYNAITSVKWESLATSIGQHVIDAITTGAGLVWDAATWLGNTLAGVKWETLGQTLKDGAIGGMLAIVGWGQDVVTWVAGVLQGVDWSSVGTKIVEGIKAVFEGAQGLAQAIDDAVTKHPEQVKSAGNAAAVQFKLGWNEGMSQPTAGGGGGSGGGGLIGTILDGLKQKFVDVYNAGKDLAKQLGEFAGAVGRLYDALKPLEPILKPVAEGLAAIAVVVVDTILLSSLDKIRGLLGDFTLIVKGLTLAVDGAANVITWLDDFKTHWNNLKDAIQPGVDKISTGVDDVKRLFKTIAAGDFWSGIATDIVSALTGIASDWYEGGKAWLQRLWDGIKEKYGEAKSWVETTLTEMPGTVGTAMGSLWQVGSDWVGGLYDGMVAAWDSLDPLGWIQGKGEDLVSALDPFHHSPWPATIAAGYDWTMGLVVGMQQGVPALQQAIQGVGVSIGAALGNLVAGGGSGGGLLPAATAVGTEIGKAITAAIGIAITGTPTLPGSGGGGGVGIGSIINSPALQALLPKLKDFGVSMIGKLSDGIAAGRLTMQGALDLLNGMVAASLTDLDATNDLHVSDMITKLQDLASTYQDQLAQAMLDGTDPTQIKANLQAITALLDQYINTTAASVAETNASADAATALADAQQKLADKLQQVADNAQKATDALAANNLANGIGGPPSGTNTIGLPGTKIGGGKGLLTNPGVLVAPTINYGGSGGGSTQLTGANGQPFTRTNPLPVAVVAGTGGNTYTINAPDASPAAIRAALLLVSLQQAREMAALGVGG